MEVRLGPVPTPQGTQGNVFVVPSPQSPDARNKNPTHLDMLKAITALTFPPFFWSSGYIPKGEHYFGKPYADTCLSAIASFQEDQVKNNRKIRDLRTIAELQKGKDVPKEMLSSDTLITTKYKTPLKSITIRPKAYYSPFALQHSLSPFIMSNDDPKKFLMSGYTGFVPRARGEMGMGYPLLTNKALCDFTVESDRLKRVKELPITVDRPEIKIVDTKPIYIRGSGQVPHYTGHVPGTVSILYQFPWK